ncbi:MULTISPECIES: aldehyde dehydrogenase family protein [Streptomyces]|uniref:aldehyde dehydrogenase family protein n=1 Tax=Streptomyces TaxID=1883 RepID=UPI00068B4204|nr:MULTISPECIES: aldehyde dehydrogenase family protein [Streptomyces]ARH92069.1 aldehyde dehydrogenase [Streptomyces sp. MOE7]MDC7338103.1 aldehyde dehydrogenase family protein [Streptomyces lydicus]UEG92470.1 aldehyde dehydrogenase family protein [Streptomyces lydicus]
MSSAPAWPTVAAEPEGSLARHRAAAVHRVRDFLVNDAGTVHELLCEISTHRAARYEIESTVATLDGALDEVAAHRPGRVPRLAAFMPSNVILYSYALYLLVPALYTDRLVFRPSSRVKDQMRRLHTLLAEQHGLPIELTTASQRDFLHDHVLPADVVVFTGAYANAEQIRARLSPGQLFLFLGSGVNPFVVAPGADVERAARDAIAIRVLNTGQDCLGPDLFSVHEPLLEPFVDALVSELKGLRYGPYTDPDADFGPIFYDSALEDGAQFLARHRGDIVHGGHVDFRGRRLDPTVVVGEEVTPRTHVPEFFAPIFNVASYRDEDALATTLTTGMFTERALGSSVYGHAPRLVEALRRRTTVTLDTTLLSIDDGNAPFGGYGRMANYISDGHEVRAEPVLISKAVAAHRPGAAR